jgi:hypothetical protein
LASIPGDARFPKKIDAGEALPTRQMLTFQYDWLFDRFMRVDTNGRKPDRYQAIGRMEICGIAVWPVLRCTRTGSEILHRPTQK